MTQPTYYQQRIIHPEGSEFGPGEAVVFVREGPLGALHAGALTDGSGTKVVGPDGSEAFLPLVPDGRPPSRKEWRSGVRGTLCGAPLVLRKHGGLRRSRRRIVVEAGGLPPRVLRLRGMSGALSLEAAEGRRLAWAANKTSPLAASGEAQVPDVMLVLLCLVLGMERELKLGLLDLWI
ncbi:MAG: hypothetical protein ACRDPK_03920 [Carbonactinosporaceae bacterium]